jgi:predicted phosphodiesterase
VKQRIKTAVNYISDFEEKLTELARARGCDGIICGHIHQPAIREIDGILYMNSGDWVESMSALVEDHKGLWHLLYYSDDMASDAIETDADSTEEEVPIPQNQPIQQIILTDLFTSTQ